ncbi:MAG: cellulose synthase complex periplasmic endoglucanase BcsZ [Gallionella sp.]
MIFSLSSIAHAQSCDANWPAWETFKKHFISKKGRVIDIGSKSIITTSEGQSYALFFSLIANDRTTFEKLLNWTAKNQAHNDLTTRLPAWLWGKNQDGDWGTLDSNPASDADLWMAYALGVAGELWGNRRYMALSSLLANRILNTETKKIAGLGLVLLPGKVGFTPTPTSVRLNPSYVPMQLMHWFANKSDDLRWTALLNSSQQLILKSSPKGYAPDWTIYDATQGFLHDEKNSIGSYNAIRVYLWAGMLSPDTPERSLLLDALKPMAQLIDKRGSPPETINTITGATNNTGPSGFSAAMIPFLQAEGYTKAAEQQLMNIKAKPISNDRYYDQVLSLFALGWHENLYRFDSRGNLTLRWISLCD